MCGGRETLFVAGADRCYGNKGYLWGRAMVMEIRKRLSFCCQKSGASAMVPVPVKCAQSVPDLELVLEESSVHDKDH
jgi:hypothetical protein